ncbi:C/D box methylation guide ribonucleoprotein complex aNOP56 subunit [Candidatus Bathyarchaeota archaeon]|nr:C/D box methylation guide ribonucleoprotein complex aNOP56 subunit [Candidatus Bathyarchaeota archaeon]
MAFNERDEMIDSVLFPREPERAARILSEIEAGDFVEEIAHLVESLLTKNHEMFLFENTGLAKTTKERLNVKTKVTDMSTTKKTLQSNMANLAVQTGFVDSHTEFERWMQELTLETARLRVKRAAEKEDLIVTHTIQTLDDMDRTINLFMGRVREWYGIHFPELDRLLDKHETYARLVFELGNKTNFTEDELAKKEIPGSRAKRIAKSARTSMGADLTEADLAQIQGLCTNTLELFKLRQNLEDYVNTTMESVAPNIKAIVGSLLGARLIALAGGLINLAKMPASTLQVLGAEKALFRSLKTGSRPPKHGIIFQHPLLHEAKKWQRGKVARALAGKIAIAARADAFGGRYIAEELNADLHSRVEEIQEKYTHPTMVSRRRPKGKKRRTKKRASKS